MSSMHHASLMLCRCCHLAALDRSTRRPAIRQGHSGFEGCVHRGISPVGFVQWCLFARLAGITRLAGTDHTKRECHLFHIAVIYVICGVLFTDGQTVERKICIVGISSVSLLKLWFPWYASVGLWCIKPMLQKLFKFCVFLPRPVVPC
jgi:hypothetical protein